MPGRRAAPLAACAPDVPADDGAAGFALSDPYGLAASLAIAPQFDLFYTQDPQTLADYAGRGVAAKRCDPATDPELYQPPARGARVRRPLLRKVDALPQRPR